MREYQKNADIMYSNSAFEYMMQAIKSTIGDASYIASSACRMAAERSNDVKVNSVVTFILMRELCTINIDAQKKMIASGTTFKMLCEIMNITPIEQIDEMTGAIEELARELVSSEKAIHKIDI